MLYISYNLYYVKYKIGEFIFQELMYPLYIDFYKIIGRKKNRRILFKRCDLIISMNNNYSFKLIIRFNSSN